MNSPDRTAVLRSLPRYGFTPPPDGAAVPTDANAAFAAQVEALAAAFWALAPADRRARWRSLADDPVGPAATRLAELEPGLDVTPVPQTEIHTAEIAQLVRELFVLPPAARAARRLAWVSARDRQNETWRAASRALLRTDLPLARLDERLFDWFSLGARPAAVAAVAESAATVRRRVEPVADPLPTPAPAAGGVGCLSGSGVIIFAVVVILRVILSAAGPSRSSYTPPPYTPPPVYKPAPLPDGWPPPVPDVRPHDPNGPFTIGEMVEFQNFEKTHGTRPLPGTPRPLRYDKWVEKGRPMGGLVP